MFGEGVLGRVFLVTGGLGCGRGGVFMRVVLLLMVLVWRLGAADRVGERAWVGGGNPVVSRVPRSTSGYRLAPLGGVRGFLIETN